MSQVSEIKCPVCEKWCNWTGKTDEKCPNCGELLDPEGFRYEEEKKILIEKSQYNRYLIIKDTDDTIVQMAKQFINWLKWTTFYGLSIVYVALGIIIVMFGLIMLL
jgi:predicted amidophosphoribosyltransferase